MMKMLPERRFRFTAQIVLACGCCLFLLVALGSKALAQDASAAPAAEEEIPRSAWLLPVIDLTKGEPVTWTLALCSVVACTLILQGFMRVRRAVLLPPESNQRIEQLIMSRQYRELMEFTANDDGFVSRSLHPALKRAPNIADMREALETGIAEETAEQFRKLDYVNLLANVGPLLGLLGTVIGIMDAFLAMRRSGGSAEVGELAAGISTALGTTLVGLCLAVPCLVFYSILRNKADRLTQEGAQRAEDYFQMMKVEGRDARVASAAVNAMASGTPAGRPVPAPPRLPSPAAGQSAPPVVAQ
jgi:biopolymer transport protein ExbB